MRGSIKGSVIVMIADALMRSAAVAPTHSKEIQSFGSHGKCALNNIGKS